MHSLKTVEKLYNELSVTVLCFKLIISNSGPNYFSNKNNFNIVEESEYRIGIADILNLSGSSQFKGSDSERVEPKDYQLKFRRFVTKLQLQHQEVYLVPCMKRSEPTWFGEIDMFGIGDHRQGCIGKIVGDASDDSDESDVEEKDFHIAFLIQDEKDVFYRLTSKCFT